jgi:hypothetical protein
MKTFYEWLEAMTVNQPVPQAQPQQQTPQPQQAPQQPKTVSLSTLAPQVSDTNWHSLYDYFAQRQPKTPNDPAIKELGATLYQTAQNNNFNALQPLVAKYIHAQPIRQGSQQAGPQVGP